MKPLNKNAVIRLCSYSIIGVITLLIAKYFISVDLYHKFEESFTYYWLLLAFLFWLATAVSVRHILWNWFKAYLPEDKKSASGLIVLILIASTYTWVHVKPNFGAFYDEPAYYMVAQEMYQNHTTIGCRAGSYYSSVNLNCDATYYEYRPHFHSLLTTVMFQFTGVNIQSAFLINFILYCLTGIFVFCLCRRFGSDFKGATLSALIWYFWPMVIVRAQSAGLEISSACMLILSVCIAVLYIDREKESKSPKASLGLDLFLGLTAGLAAQTRPESPLFVLIGIIPSVIYARAGVVAAGLISFVPYLMNKGYLDNGQFHLSLTESLKRLPTYLPNNLNWLFNLKEDQGSIQPLFLILALLGLARSVYIFRKNQKFLLPSAFLFPFIILFFSMETDFKNGRVDNRYILMALPFAAVLAGFFYSQCELLSQRIRTSIQSGIVVALVFGIMLASPMLDAESLGTKQPPRVDFQYVQKEIKSYDPKSVFFTSSGEMILPLGFAAFGYDTLDMLDEKHGWWSYIWGQSEGNLYYITGWECYPDPGDTRFIPYSKGWVKSCESIEKRYKLKETYRRTTGIGYDFVIYKILGFKSQSKKDK